MRTVHLTLPIKPDGETVELWFGIEPSAEDLVTFTKYSEYMSRVRNASILRRGMGGLEGFHLSQERGLEIRAADWSDAELHELLHVLRPVTLKREQASYSKVTALLHECFPFENVREFVAQCNQAYEHGEGSFYIQLKVGEQVAFDESLLRLWLNGTQYHTDEKKAELWAELEATISASSARALVVSQLHSKTLALLNVDYIVKQVLSGENDA